MEKAIVKQAVKKGMVRTVKIAVVFAAMALLVEGCTPQRSCTNDVWRYQHRSK